MILLGWKMWALMEMKVTKPIQQMVKHLDKEFRREEGHTEERAEVLPVS